MVIIRFPEDGWVGGGALDDLLSDDISLSEGQCGVRFEIPPDTKILIDAAVIFLSLLNQMVDAGDDVILDFKTTDSAVMGYFNRMGFFDHLNSNVVVLPERPILSGARIFNKTNRNLIEIAPINPAGYDDDLPTRLADVLETRNRKLGKASFTIFGELIDNVQEHSSTKLCAFAALQTYRTGIKVVVSDSGDGLLETLRPRLPKKYRRVSDIALVLEAFKNGLSRYGMKSGRGCGLTTCAQKAIQYNGVLEVRLATSRVNLVPSINGYTPNTAYCYDNLLPLRGTHISFDFRLDN